MRVLRLVPIVVWSLALIVPVLPAGALEVESGNDRGMFVNAGWDVIDPRSGADRYLMVQASGPADPRAPGTLVSVFGATYRTVRCDGVEATWMREVGAEGTGTISITPQLTRGTLAASLDVTIGVMDPCAGTWIQRVRHDVPIGLALRPDGPIRHDSGGSSQLLPSFSGASQHIQVRVRSAVGRVIVGGSDVRSGWGEFGRIHGIWHVRAPADASVMTATMAALRAATTERDRQWLAGAADQRDGRDRRRAAEVDAVRSSDGSVIVFASSYAARTVICPDGSRADVEIVVFGEASGVLAIGPHLGRATASATIDLTRAVRNGCTERGSERVLPGVPVTLVIVADGPVVMTGEWYATRTPSEVNDRIRLGMRARSASGGFAIGDVRHEGSTWGVIALFRARSHIEAMP